MKKLVVAVIGVCALTNIFAVPGTVKTSTGTKRGDIQYSRSSKVYTLTYKKGNTNVTEEFKAGEVEMEVDKPANFDKYVALVNGPQAANAIAPLSAIVKEYRGLTWDHQATQYLVEAYLAANNAQKAFDSALTIINEEKSAAYTGSIAPAYWKALLKLGKNTQLENCLRKAMESGDRASSAAAFVMRGDQILTNGDTPDLCRQALTDAYLRVVLMFTDEPCRAARKEALQKAALCFEKLGMASRAENMRAQSKEM